MKKIFRPPWGWDNKVKLRQRAKKLEYAFQKQKSKRCITWKCSKNKYNSARDRKRRKKIRQIIYLYTSVMVLTRNILLVYSVHKVVIIIFFAVCMSATTYTWCWLLGVKDRQRFQRGLNQTFHLSEFLRKFRSPERDRYFDRKFII